jgi:hypothetical protein
MLAYDRLALDRGSIRTVDKDGRLHVDLTPISKAVVNPYMGKEIPGFEELGLDAETVYNLYRDPVELAKAAPSFNKLPVLSEHVPVDAEDYAPDLVVGATGERASFSSPYLMQSMVVWAKPAIDGIVDNSKKELSCAYHYTPDMTAGNANGVAYDGVMRGILGNHLAIVVEGRAGKDIVIGDSMPKEILEMAKAKIDYNVVFKKPEFAKLLAQDGVLEGFTALLTALGNAGGAGDAGVLEPVANAVPAAPAANTMMDADPMAPAAPAAPAAPGADPAAPAPAAGGSGVAGIKQFLAGKLTPEDMAALEKMISALGGGEGDKPAAPGGEDDDTDGAAPAQDEEGVDDNAAPVLDPYDTKRKVNNMSGAMDAAVVKTQIAAAVKVAADQATKVQREIRDAERDVRPWVGELAMSFDSGEQVYRHVLEMLKVDGAKEVPAAALKTILKLVPQPGARVREDYAPAMDAAAAKSLADRYPGFDKIGFA